MNTQTPPKLTLEEITKRKEELLVEIRKQKEVMTDITREIFAPLQPATSKADAIMRSFNTGMAIFDGVKTGIKIMGKVRSYFNRMK